MEKKVSIKDIARHLGVSTALVSYVLNNKAGRVSVEMAEKIRQAAAELNYRPNLIARSLQSGKTNTLGLIVADISNPFFSHIARIIEDEAKKAGYTVIFGSSDENVEKSQALMDALLNRQVDALIIAPAEFTEEQLKALQKKNIPFVLIDRYFKNIQTNSVRIDNHRAAYTAVEHLIKTGSRRIAMLAYNTGMQHIADRIEGYKDAMKDNGIKPKESWLVRASYHHLEEEAAGGMEKLLSPKPTVDAFFFATNSLAIQGIRQIIRLNIKVPDDLSVISFDEADAFDFFYAPITYVRQSLEDIGRHAVQLALDSLSKQPVAPKEVIVDAGLIIRESSKK
ncbi:MAG TPA: LacI family DNA-binding transcriptional regulator [Puia sp.]|nr:LacI family DNA-binding transcriptional regulator [Puia sp.]